MKRKITTTIYLTEEQQTLLKELSQRSKVPVAEYIRQGVDLILKKNARQLPGQLSFILDKKIKIRITVKNESGSKSDTKLFYYCPYRSWQIHFGG